MAQNQVRLDIERREPFAGGGSFGNTGPYERLFGKVYFAIDPEEKGLPSIVDLDLAPRNAQGRVEFAARRTPIASSLRRSRRTPWTPLAGSVRWYKRGPTPAVRTP